MADSVAGPAPPPRQGGSSPHPGPESGAGPAGSAPSPEVFRPATDARTAERMSRQARKDTAPEIALRRELHRRGLRYRVEYPVPGMPRRRLDIAFPRAEVAVLVDGCFWHACPRHATNPANNQAWWSEKLRRNVERDRETDAHLASLGWVVVRVWEHEAPAAAADRVEAAVRAAQEG